VEVTVSASESLDSFIQPHWAISVPFAGFISLQAQVHCKSADFSSHFYKGGGLAASFSTSSSPCWCLLVGGKCEWVAPALGWAPARRRSGLATRSEQGWFTPHSPLCRGASPSLCCSA